MTVSHILVPYDGTISSERAFDEALKITKKYHNTLTLVSCFEEGSIPESYLAEVTTDFKGKILNKIKDLEKKAISQEVRFTHFFIKNSSRIQEEILKFADQNHVDMIIIGPTSKPTKFTYLFSSSVSKDVQRFSKCVVKLV